MKIRVVCPEWWNPDVVFLWRYSRTTWATHAMQALPSPTVTVDCSVHIKAAPKLSVEFDCCRWRSGCGGRHESNSEPSGPSFLPEKRPQETEVPGGWAKSSWGTGSVCACVCVCACISVCMTLIWSILLLSDHSDWPECLSDPVCGCVSVQRPEQCGHWYTLLHFDSPGKHMDTHLKTLHLKSEPGF